MSYKVMIEDNNHWGEDNEEHHPYGGGTFATEAEAIAKCKEIVDDFLEGSLQADERAGNLKGQYRAYGEDPWIEGTDGDRVIVGFSGRDYADERIDEFFRKHS